MSLWRLALAVLVAYACKPWRMRRYRQCLARIEALEIALGMREAPNRFGPGAMWAVNDPLDVRPYHNPPYVQIVRNPYTALALKHNLTRSAFYAALARPEDAQ